MIEITGHSDVHYFERDGVKSVVYLMDCMDGMKQIPDKYFDLAVVDPPYGIKIAEWDAYVPNETYFFKIDKLSNNRIIWGGNYFNLPHTQSWICWDKTHKFNRNIDLSEFELAWTSFTHKAKFCRFTYCGNFYGWDKPRANYNKPTTIHPTQKPVEIYDWIYKNYGQDCKRVLDTHLGSQSNRIAAFKAGIDFMGFELDEDYYRDGNKRFENFSKQLTLL